MALKNRTGWESRSFDKYLSANGVGVVSVHVQRLASGVLSVHQKAWSVGTMGDGVLLWEQIIRCIDCDIYIPGGSKIKIGMLITIITV